MYLRTIFEAADTSGDGEISVAEAIKAVRNDDDFAARPRRFTDTSM